MPKIISVTTTRFRAYGKRPARTEVFLEGEHLYPIATGADPADALKQAAEYVLASLENGAMMPEVIAIPSYSGKVMVVFPSRNQWGYAFYHLGEPATKSPWGGGSIGFNSKAEAMISAISHARQIEDLPEGDT